MLVSWKTKTTPDLTDERVYEWNFRVEGRKVWYWHKTLFLEISSTNSILLRKPHPRIRSSWPQEYSFSSLWFLRVRVSFSGHSCVVLSRTGRRSVPLSRVFFGWGDCVTGVQRPEVLILFYVKRPTSLVRPTRHYRRGRLVASWLLSFMSRLESRTIRHISVVTLQRGVVHISTPLHPFSHSRVKSTVHNPPRDSSRKGRCFAPITVLTTRTLLHSYRVFTCVSRSPRSSDESL